MQILKDENQNLEFSESWQDEYLKWICAFANSNGGTLYIGVDDKGFIKGVDNYHKLSESIPLKLRTTMGLFCPVEIMSDEDKKYIKITVDKYPFPVSYHGKYYKRVGSTTQKLTGVELDKLVMSTQGRTWDSVPVPNVNVQDLDILPLRIFRKKAIDSRRMDETSLDVSDETLLHNLHLFEQEYLNRAAILAFHQDPENWFIGSYIKIGYFVNEADIAYQDEVHGPLLYQVEQAINIVYTKYMKALISYDGIQRKETFFFPKEAF